MPLRVSSGFHPLRCTGRVRHMTNLVWTGPSRGLLGCVQFGLLVGHVASASRTIHMLLS